MIEILLPLLGGSVGLNFVLLLLRRMDRRDARFWMGLYNDSTAEAAYWHDHAVKNLQLALRAHGLPTIDGEVRLAPPENRRKP